MATYEPGKLAALLFMSLCASAVIICICCMDVDSGTQERWRKKSKRKPLPVRTQAEVEVGCRYRLRHVAKLRAGADMGSAIVRSRLQPGDWVTIGVSSISNCLLWDNCLLTLLNYILLNRRSAW